MKRKIYSTGIICLLLLVLFIIAVSGYRNKSKMSRLYEEYRYPNEEFYGKELYSEIDYECSDYESKVGNEIANRGLEVLQYSGTEQDAETEMGNVGALGQYYCFHTKNAVLQKGTLKFITCKTVGNEGHVWVVYTCGKYDENGSLVNGSSDILSLWHIEKQGDEWFVVRIQEAP